MLCLLTPHVCPHGVQLVLTQIFHICLNCEGCSSSLAFLHRPWPSPSSLERPVFHLGVVLCLCWWSAHMSACLPSEPTLSPNTATLPLNQQVMRWKLAPAPSLSFSFSPLPFVCVRPVTVFSPALTPGVGLVAFVGSWDWYQNNQISPSFTCGAAAAKQSTGFYGRAQSFTIDRVHSIDFTWWYIFLQEKGEWFNLFSSAVPMTPDVLFAVSVLSLLCLITHCSIYTPCYPWVKAFLAGDAEWWQPGKECPRWASAEGTAPGLLEELLNGTLSSTAGYVSGPTSSGLTQCDELSVSTFGSGNSRTRCRALFFI